MKHTILRKATRQNGSLNSNFRRLLTTEELEFLSNQPGRTLPEKLYLLTHEKQYCPSCGAEVAFASYVRGYRIFCSPKCSNSDSDKKDKIRASFIERFGVDNPQKLDSIKNATKETKTKLYGSAFYNPSETKRTKLKRYGSAGYVNPEKTSQTKLERYGSSTYNNRDQARETCLEKYGSAQGYMKVRYLYNDLIFDSSWELVYYMWLSDSNVDFVYKPSPLVFASGQRRYYPDFLVEGEYVEIKANTSVDRSTGQLKLHPRQKRTDAALERLSEKQACLDMHNVKVLLRGSPELDQAFEYVKNAYGLTYIKSLRERRDSANHKKDIKS